MSEQTGLSRRGFLCTTAACLGSRLRAAEAPSPWRIREFPYSQVRLTGGPLAGQYRRTHAHFLTLDNDRILKIYRERAGLPAPGTDMGGWYDKEGFVPGHLVGQFISGLARLHANTGDPAAAAKALALMNGYAAALGPDDNPFASPKASTTWPCYILDKYEIGMIDAATLLKSKDAPALLARVIQGGTKFIPDHTYDRGPNSPKHAPYDEPYILPENLFKTYEVTGDRRYLQMAKTYLLDKEFFDPLSQNRNILPGKHGYSHVIALSSGAKAYEVLGEKKYFDAIRNAWDMLEQTQMYASGAWAPKETFLEPHKGLLAESLTSTRDHFETPCCYYAHQKLARYLLGFTAESRYGDGLERALLNTILGSLDPGEDGRYFYYSDYQAHAKKGYYKMKWPCCAGTLVQSVADYPICLYFHSGDGIYVNLFAESEVEWKAGGVPVKLAQRTAYPESETVELRVDPERPAEFTVAVRIPGWLDKPAELKVNGKPAAVPARPGTFAKLRRRWNKNDTVQLTLPFSFRTVAIDDRNPDLVAVMRGPLMMNVVNPPEVLKAKRADLARMAPVAGKPLEFACRTAGGELLLKPFYQVRDEVYSTYWRMES